MIKKPKQLRTAWAFLLARSLSFVKTICSITFQQNALNH